MCVPPSDDDASLHLLPGWARPLIERAARAGEDVSTAVPIAIAAGRRLPLPGQGQTLLRWGVLAALARVNLTVARIAEAHTDALAILAEAGQDSSADGSWGVFAAEAPGHQLTATDHGDRRVTLTGSKAWCSLGDVLDHALVTAHVDGGRRLFRVDLDDPGVRADPARGWVARGLRSVTSVPITFHATPAVPVGDRDWYLTRPGFAWGGLGVAACWHGGATGVADTVRSAAIRRTGELNALNVGVVEVALYASACALAHAARCIDAGHADAGRGDALALRGRAVVADTVERVLRQAGHALGPAPLAFDPDHAARVNDLSVYVRQHHAERDLAALGQGWLDRAAR